MDDGGSQGLWIFVFVLLCFAVYFAIAETSFASVNRIRIKAAAEHGDKRAAKALTVLDQFDRAVTSILIGTNITHLGIASIVTVLVIRIWGAGAVSVSTLATTIAVFFLGEMLPKSLAKRYCESLALATASSLLFFMKLFSPVAFILTSIGQAAARLVGETEEVSVTEEELHGIIESMADDGMLCEEQSELMNSALEFTDVTVGSIHTVRDDMEAIPIDMPPDKVAAFLLSHGHSRYPVYDGSINFIVGTLRMRRFLKAYSRNAKVDLRALIDPPLFVHQGDDVLGMIHEMNRQKVSLAIVLDDQGQTCGLITVEDALEELISSISDDDEDTQSCVATGKGGVTA